MTMFIVLKIFGIISIITLSITMNRYLTAHTELRIIEKIRSNTFGYPTINHCLEVLNTANRKVFNRHIESTNLKLEHELFMCEIKRIEREELL